MVLPAPPALAPGAILPQLRVGRLAGIPGSLQPRVAENRRDPVILHPADLLQLRRPEGGRRYLLTGGPDPPGLDWLCRARALAAQVPVGVFGWSPRSLLAWCDCLLVTDQAGRTRRYSCSELRRAARLRVTGYGPGSPPLVSRGHLRRLGAGRFEAILPLARFTAEEVLSAWLGAGWRVEASAVSYPALEMVLDGAVPEDSFPALPASPDRYRYACRDQPAEPP